MCLTTEREAAGRRWQRGAATLKGLSPLRIPRSAPLCGRRNIKKQQAGRFAASCFLGVGCNGGAEGRCWVVVCGSDLGGTLSPFGAAPSAKREPASVGISRKAGLTRDGFPQGVQPLPLHRGGCGAGVICPPPATLFGRQEMHPQPTAGPHATVESDVKSPALFRGG